MSRYELDRAVRRQQQGQGKPLSQAQADRSEQIRKKLAQGQALGENLYTPEGEEVFVYGFSPMDDTVVVL